MSNDINSQRLIEIINCVAKRIHDNRDVLNTLDSALGDGDHGTGISTAFNAAVEDIEALSEPDIMTVLKTTAMALMNRMGGASGALYGSFFLKAAMTTKDKVTLSKSDCDELLQAGLEGVKKRGKSDVGDKTMIDALNPAVMAFVEADSLSNGWEKAAQAAQVGAENTKNLIAKHGRAKFAGERAIGHQDAGASSITLLFEAIHDYWKDLS
ncbi:MAG: dihydroxyacetone kinase subunit DhaL [Phototrophicaceae bacterium]